MDILVHPRISERHPEISPEDVLAAWKSPLDMLLRVDSLNFPEYVCIGYDPKGQLLEMVGTMTNDGWLIYHAMTPPSKKTLKEIEEARRRGS